MALFMVVDRMTYKWFGVITVLSFGFLIFCVILGVLGPNQRVIDVDYAYNCVNGSHVWNPDNCMGVQLGSNQSTAYWHVLPQLNKLNSLWKLSMYPYDVNYPNSDLIEDTLQIDISVFARQNQDSSWYSISEQTTVDDYLICNEKDEECVGISLVYEDSINYLQYAVRVALPDVEENYPAKYNIGDVKFEYQWVNEDFSVEEILVRILFLAASTTLFGFYIYRLKKIPKHQWTLEQRLTIIMHVSLIFLNNPVYVFEFILPGSFFPMLNSFFIVIQQTTLLLIWLMIFDYYRQGTLNLKLSKTDIIKPILISVYAIMSFALFTWFRLADLNNPVLGENSGSLSFFLLLFVITALTYGAIVLWVILLIAMAVSKVIKDRGLFVNRLLLLGTASGVMIASMVVSLLFGNFGPINKTSVAFVYFFTLNNLYTWIVTAGYWPYNLVNNDLASTMAQTSENSEDTPIFPQSVENFLNSNDSL